MKEKDRKKKKKKSIGREEDKSHVLEDLKTAFIVEQQSGKFSRSLSGLQKIVNVLLEIQFNGG